MAISLRDDNRVHLELIEPEGSVWDATCGYQYGAGHMEEYNE